MSDMTAVRRALDVFEASYPPEILGGGTGPHINSVTPASWPADVPVTLLTIAGRNFAADSVVEVDQAPVQSQFNSETEMLAEGHGALGAGPHIVTVRNADENESNSFPVTVTPGAPEPVLASIAPTTVSVVSASMTLDCYGSNFIDGSLILFGGAQMAATWLDATHLRAVVNPSNQGEGVINVAVMDPNDMSLTNTLPFTITAAAVTTAEVEPEAEPPAPKRKTKTTEKGGER